VSATIEFVAVPAHGTTPTDERTMERLYGSSVSAFAVPTQSVVPRGDQVDASARHAGRTEAVSVADPALLAELADAPELQAIEQLRAWLRLTYDDVARVAGLSGPSLLHHWRKRQRTGLPVRPRASSVEHLWRVHALVHAVAEALEAAGHVRAVQLWARRGVEGTTPLELLLAGRVDEVERHARGLLFGQSARPTSSWRLAGLEDDAELERSQPLVEYQDSDFG